MVYLVMGTGTPNSLDIEHMVNTLFKATRYGKKIYFPANDEINNLAYDACLKWKKLNSFGVELERFSFDREAPVNFPKIVDCVINFIDKDFSETEEFKTRISKLSAEGIRYENYVLGSWDNDGKVDTF